MRPGRPTRRFALGESGRADLRDWPRWLAEVARRHDKLGKIPRSEGEPRGVVVRIIGVTGRAPALPAAPSSAPPHGLGESAPRLAGADFPVAASTVITGHRRSSTRGGHRRRSDTLRRSRRRALHAVVFQLRHLPPGANLDFRATLTTPTGGSPPQRRVPDRSECRFAIRPGSVCPPSTAGGCPTQVRCLSSPSRRSSRFCPPRFAPIPFLRESPDPPPASTIPSRASHSTLRLNRVLPPSHCDRCHPTDPRSP